MKDLINKLAQDKKIVIFIVIICFIIIYLDFSFILKAQFSSIKDSGPKIIKLKQDLEQFAKDFKKMQDFQANEKSGKQSGLKKNKRLISEGEIVSLLDGISDSAEKNKVVISHMKYSRESVTTTAKQSKAVSSPKMLPLLINIELTAGYHELGKFIDDLENLPVFLALQNMKISLQSADFLKQKVTLSLRTYVRK